MIRLLSSRCVSRETIAVQTRRYLGSSLGAWAGSAAADGDHDDARGPSPFAAVPTSSRRRGEIFPRGRCPGGASYGAITCTNVSQQRRQQPSRWAHGAAVRMPVRSSKAKRAPPPPPASSSASPRLRRPPSRRQRARALKRSTANAIHFRSLGCPRNFVDTEHMLGLVLRSGFVPTDDAAAADYVVVNTCGFLKAARDEGRGEIEDIIDCKKEGSKLIVTGCMINIKREEILGEYPEIDAVLGSGAVDKILEAIESCRDGDGDDDDHVVAAEVNNEREVDAEESDGEEGRPPRPRPRPEPRSYLANGDVPRRVATPSHYAYLKIAEGCMKRCAFCIIPKIKGPLRSKSVEQVVREFGTLLDGGAREIVLIAQDLGDYGKDLRRSGSAGPKRGGELAHLLKAMLDSTDDPSVWIRLMYLYPDEITDELIAVLKSDDRVCRYLDMPIQHINDDLLKRMKRRTTGTDIRNTISKLREEFPEMHIRTSLMVGFPGETEEQFQELLDFVTEAELENVGAFEYSDEEMAKSSAMPDKVPESIKADRYARLMEAQFEIVRRRNAGRAREGERLEVVLEGARMVEEVEAPGGTGAAGAAARQVLVGRYYGQCPDVDGMVIIDDCESMSGPPALGERYQVQVTDFDGYDLIGRIV